MRTVPSESMVMTSRRLAPEDIRVRDYVGILREKREYLIGFSLDGVTDPRQITLDWTNEGGTPYRVCAIALPWVLVKRPDGKAITLDVRRHTLARVDPEYGRRAFRLLAPKRKKKRGAGKPGRKRK